MSGSYTSHRDAGKIWHQLGCGWLAAHMFVAVVPRPLDDLAGVALVLFLCGVGEHADVVVHVKTEQRARLAARLVDDKVVERIVLGLGTMAELLPT